MPESRELRIRMNFDQNATEDEVEAIWRAFFKKIYEEEARWEASLPEEVLVHLGDPVQFEEIAVVTSLGQTGKPLRFVDEADANEGEDDK